MDYLTGSLVDHRPGRVLVTSEHLPSRLPFRETLQAQSHRDDWLQAVTFQRTSGLREVSGSPVEERQAKAASALRCFKNRTVSSENPSGSQGPCVAGKHSAVMLLVSPKLLRMCPWWDFCMQYCLKMPHISDPFAEIPPGYSKTPTSLSG